MLKPLEQIIRCRGGLIKVSRRLSKKIGRDIARQHVAMWFNEGRQPRSDMFIALLELQEEMVSEKR